VLGLPLRANWIELSTNNLGWWIPVVPTLLVLVINGVGLTAFYQYDRNLRGQIQERQIIIERTFDTITMARCKP
jgi:hypothetical protein